MKDINRRNLLLGLAASAVALPTEGYTFPDHPVWPFQVSYDVNAIYPEMVFDIEKITVKAGMRALKADYCHEFIGGEIHNEG